MPSLWRIYLSKQYKHGLQKNLRRSSSVIKKSTLRAGNKLLSGLSTAAILAPHITNMLRIITGKLECIARMFKVHEVNLHKPSVLNANIQILRVLRLLP